MLANYMVLANRTIAGTVRGSLRAYVRVRLVELGRSATTDATGVFVFRGVPPGKYTLTSVVDGQAVSRTVEVPEGPGLVRDADFGLQ